MMMIDGHQNGINFSKLGLENSTTNIYTENISLPFMKEDRLFSEYLNQSAPNKSNYEKEK